VNLLVHFAEKILLLNPTNARGDYPVRIALTSGLTRRQIADDLGIGMSTLNKWITAHRDTDVVSADDRALVRENEQLRREIRILKEERDILKKATQFFASQKP
jgi:transposase